MKVEVDIPSGKYCRTGWTCDFLGLSHSSDEVPVFCVRVNGDVEWDNYGRPIKHPDCPGLKGEVENAQD